MFKVSTATVFLGLIVVFLLPSPVSAKRLLPRVASKAALATSSKTTSTSKGITSSVRFRGDRRAINATFTNLGIASAISYQLTYDVNGITQGAGGSVSTAGPEPVVREILFGTCSHGICRYDSGIKNAKFTVTTTLKSGKKIVKGFRLKV